MNTHDCPGGCGRQVPRHLFACHFDWYRLPVYLRRPISRNWQVDRRAHAEAMGDAIRWYQENAESRHITPPAMPQDGLFSEVPR